MGSSNRKSGVASSDWNSFILLNYSVTIMEKSSEEAAAHKQLPKSVLPLLYTESTFLYNSAILVTDSLRKLT